MNGKGAGERESGARVADEECALSCVSDAPTYIHTRTHKKPSWSTATLTRESASPMRVAGTYHQSNHCCVLVGLGTRFSTLAHGHLTRQANHKPAGVLSWGVRM